MPTRIQSIALAVSQSRQADIATAAGNFIRLKKLNTDVPILRYGTETDATEIGKGNEFISTAGVFPTAWDFAHRIEKYGSAEFVLWAWAFALGKATVAGSSYTITPQDPTAAAPEGLEMPYFSMVAQLNEAGNPCFDEMYLGNCIEDVETVFHYGPGRQSLRTTVNLLGSGQFTNPSGITLPAVLAEHYMLASSATFTLNGVDYVSEKTALMGTLGWKNNLLGGLGYLIGSGLVSNAAVRSRIFMGVRQPTFNVTVLLKSNSTEYTNLIAQTTGTSALTFTFDATHNVTFTWQSVSFQAVERTVEEGLVAVTVTVAPKFDTTNGILTITGQCGLNSIGQ